MAEKRLDSIVKQMSAEVQECSQEVTKGMKELIFIIGSTLVFIQKKKLEDEFTEFMKLNEKTLKKGFKLWP